MLHTVAMTVGEFVVTHYTYTIPALTVAAAVAIGLIARGLGWLED